MTLIYDQRQKLQGQPGLHVFIAGVSLYQHLPGGTGTLTPMALGLKQLSASALSAFKVYDWLLQREKRLPLPLATIHLLLSPSPTEVAAEPRLAGLSVARCSRQNFEVAAEGWRNAARSHVDGMALFYFAGHGVMKNRRDAVMLMDDFGAGTILSKGVELGNLYDGLAPVHVTDGIARKQIYFVDACRELPPDLPLFQQVTVPDVFDITVLSDKDDRSAPVFHATLPGIKAYALKGQETYFCRVLLDCLNKHAATGIGEAPNGTGLWGVTVQSLNKALGDFDQLVGTASEQKVTLGGSTIGMDFTLHLLDGPPDVTLELQVDPLAALSCTSVQILDDQHNLVRELPAPLNPHPNVQTVPAGYYFLGARIDPPHPSYIAPPRKGRWVLPPRTPWTAKVSQP